MQPPQQSGLTWIKASRCHATNACVELAAAGEQIAVRNSQRPDTHILYAHAEISAWLDGAKRGEFDHLVKPGS